MFREFFQKYIVAASERLHQQMVILNQTEDGHAAIENNETARRILNVDFEPWQLTWPELRHFRKECRRVYAAAARGQIEYSAEDISHYRQLYRQAWSTFKVSGLKFRWDDHRDKAVFSIDNGISITCSPNEHDALWCIRTLAGLAKTKDTDKAELYALIGYDASGQPK